MGVGVVWKVVVMRGKQSGEAFASDGTRPQLEGRWCSFQAAPKDSTFGKEGGNSLPRTQRNFLAYSGDYIRRESNLREGTEVNWMVTQEPRCSSPRRATCSASFLLDAELGDCTTCTLLPCEHRRSRVYSSEGMQYVRVNAFFRSRGVA